MSQKEKENVINDDVILVIKVGSDDRPAGIKDLKHIEKNLKDAQADMASEERSKGDSNLSIVTHHAISFNKYRKEDFKNVIIKVGSDDRPASTEDIFNVKSELMELSKKKGDSVWITHHALNFDFYSKEWIKNSNSLKHVVVTKQG